ncbi:MAG: FGGY-family carbohydrate kinase [Promethearchaeota archaeon]|jgi:sugar (pentulose or hexulose) kinase
MGSSDKILTIDISSKNVKVCIISDQLKLGSVSIQGYNIFNEDVDGFSKNLNMEDLWTKVKFGIKQVVQKDKPEKIIGISSCGQRIATVFLDRQGKEIYGGPNTDIRGIDSAYLIEDKFSEEELFRITAHSPSLMFTLARLLWFREEERSKYQKISKILMLDDWIGYKLTGEQYTDYSSAGESQLFDIKNKKWSLEIIERFNIDPEILPEIVDSSTVIGELKSDLIKEFRINNKRIPIIKGSGDTQASLLGMGAIEEGNIGITLGTTAPVHLVVNNPIIDPNLNLWTECHVVKNKWLIEANSGGTGKAYDWFKEAFISNSDKDTNEVMDEFLIRVEPGADSTYAYLGPELMAVKDQTSIKRGIFIFQPPSMIGEELPKLENFARSTIEGICFGILENFQALQPFTHSEVVTYCSGGMSKSKEFCKVLANILDKELMVPNIRDSAFTGNAMKALLGLKLYPDYKKIINELMQFEKYNADPTIAEVYKGIFKQWKYLKNKIDDL